MTITLTKRQKQIVAVALLASTGATARAIQRSLRNAQKEQIALCAELEDTAQRAGRNRKTARIAVDKVFTRRLSRIMNICIPSLFSKESGLIAAQGVLLVCRTLLTDSISRIEAKAGSNLIKQDFPSFARLLAMFTAVAVPAAVVNSGLKYMQKLIKLAFMNRLTQHLHRHYCDNRAYYAAATLGGLQQADQRITEDVEKFAYAISELYSHTFKPLLDVVLFTRSLSRIMGFKTQFALYGYYIACGALLRATSPPLSLMTAQETALSGALRSAHQRLVVHSEEVAFNDPPGGLAERFILNQHLFRLLRHSRLSAFQQFIQQVFDGYFVKYFASTVALLMYAAPLYFNKQQQPGSSTDLTQNYIRAMRLLQNTSRGIGDLVLVYKRITSLAGHTSRVAELLEQVKRLSTSNEDEVVKELYMKNVSSSTVDLASEDAAVAGNPPQRLHGSLIQFDRVMLRAPDGAILVRNLTFQVLEGRSVLIMGPNGSGKSSLFRVMAGLWPLQAGNVTLPDGHNMFYLSQRPYLVSGSLRDQLLYPLPPQALWKDAHPDTNPTFKAWMLPEYLDSELLEQRMADCMEAVGLEYLTVRGAGWNQVQSWSETLSGGEKQRLAMARLLFHHPKFAVLDECTSAVSADGEIALYQACQRAGITLLSIAHRPALRAFHSLIVHFDGNQRGAGFSLEENTPGLPRVPSVQAVKAKPVASVVPTAAQHTLSNADLKKSVPKVLGDGTESSSD